MTTGRINQVAIHKFLPQPPRLQSFLLCPNKLQQKTQCPGSDCRQAASPFSCGCVTRRHIDTTLNAKPILQAKTFTVLSRILSLQSAALQLLAFPTKRAIKAIHLNSRYSTTSLQPLQSQPGRTCVYSNTVNELILWPKKRRLVSKQAGC